MIHPDDSGGFDGDVMTTIKMMMTTPACPPSTHNVLASLAHHGRRALRSGAEERGKDKCKTQEETELAGRPRSGRDVQRTCKESQIK